VVDFFGTGVAHHPVLAAVDGGEMGLDEFFSRFLSMEKILPDE
jgi:hypothetical protein